MDDVIKIIILKLFLKYHNHFLNKKKTKWPQSAKMFVTIPWFSG